MGGQGERPSVGRYHTESSAERAKQCALVKDENVRPWINRIVLTMIPPLRFLRILVARFHIDRVVCRSLLLAATAQH